MGGLTALVLVFCGVAVSGSNPMARTTSMVEPGAEFKSAPEFSVRVKDTECRILIADVHLKIGDLVLDGGDQPALTGTYRIRVPLRPSKNEEGGMILPLEKSFKSYAEEGGTIVGTGKNFQHPEAERTITCQIIPHPKLSRNGVLRLEIDTGNRVMKFKTTYEIVGTVPFPLALNDGETAGEASPGTPSPETGS